jgi:DNA replication protein DnaC
MDPEVARYLKHVNLPKNHWDSVLSAIPDEGDRFLYKRTIQGACENIQNFCSGRSLYLYGPYGAGKSACAAIIIKAAIKRGIVQAYWITHNQLIDAVLGDYQFDDDTTLMERIQSVKLLVIDEMTLDLRKSSSWKIDVFEDLVRRRMDKQLSTIITSNYLPSQLEENAPSLHGIMQEYDFLEVRGQNFRLKR